MKGIGEKGVTACKPVTPPHKTPFLMPYTSITAWSGLFQCLAGKRKENILVDGVRFGCQLILMQQR